MILFFLLLFPAFLLVHVHGPLSAYPKIAGIKKYTPIFTRAIKQLGGGYEFSFLADFHWHRLQFDKTTTKAEENKKRYGWLRYSGKITTTNSKLTTNKMEASGKFTDVFTGYVKIAGEADLWWFEPAPKELKMFPAITSIVYKSSDVKEFAMADPKNLPDKDNKADFRGAESDNNAKTFEDKTTGIQFYVDQLFYAQVKSEEPFEVEKRIKSNLETLIAGLNAYYWPLSFGKVKQLSFKMAGVTYWKEMPEWSTPTETPREEMRILLKNWYNNRPVRIPKVGIHMMVTFRPVASHGVAYRAGVCVNWNLGILNYGMANGAVASKKQILYITKHEVGHLLGAKHDEDIRECDGQIGLLNDKPKDFDNDLALTECSVKSITSNLEEKMGNPEDETCFS